MCMSFGTRRALPAVMNLQLVRPPESVQQANAGEAELADVGVHQQKGAPPATETPAVPIEGTASLRLVAQPSCAVEAGVIKPRIMCKARHGFVLSRREARKYPSADLSLRHHCK